MALPILISYIVMLYNTKTAGLRRKWWDLIEEGKMFVKNKAKVACRMSGIESCLFWKLLLETNMLCYYAVKDFTQALRRVVTQKLLCVYRRRITPLCCYAVTLL